MKKGSNFEEIVCIIGAGLVGSLLAIYLANRGFKVDIYEKRYDIRKKNVAQNRTIAMSISYRGIKALKGVGLDEIVLKYSIPKHSRMVHKSNNNRISQQYGKNQTINTIDRCKLNSILLNRAEESENIHTHFRTEFVEMNVDSGSINMKNLEKDDCFSKQYRWIIGADGIFSDVRSSLEEKSIITTKMIKVEHGYRELNIPPDDKGNYILEKDHVHVWPRGKHVLVGLPSFGGQFTCNLFLPSYGHHSLEEIQTPQQLLKLFESEFPSVKDLMPNLEENYFSNASSNIQAVKCNKWHYRDRILLIGDAAHAIVPFFAMGMNAGFEDCTVLDSLLNKFNNDLSKVIENYDSIRKKDTDAIGDLSYTNFNDIGASQNDSYDLKWKLSRTIWDIFPNRWMPLYPMIAFSHIPFAEVVKRNFEQQQVLDDAINAGLKLNTLGRNDFAESINRYILPKLHRLP